MPVLLAIVVLVTVLWGSKALARFTVNANEGAMNGVTTDTGYVNGAPVTLTLIDIGDGQRLGLDAGRAWLRLRAQALIDGVALPVNSAFRTMEKQAQLQATLGTYGQGGLAAAAGTSPHQAGKSVDVDGINSNAPNYNAVRSDWLDANAGRFGWRRTGLGFGTKEPWHLDYLG